MSPTERNPRLGFNSDDSFGFESRVQILETKMSGLEIETAKQTLTLEYIKLNLDKGFTLINSGMSGMTERLSSIGRTIDSHDGQIKTIVEERTEAHKEIKEAKKAKKSFWSGILAAGLSAVCGAILLAIYEKFVKGHLF